MAHEKSITIKGKGTGFVNIPTVYKGRTLSKEEAVRKFDDGSIKRLGVKHSPV